MAKILSGDKFLVNRDNTTYQMEAEETMAQLQDSDYLLVNRNDETYRISGADTKDSLLPENPTLLRIAKGDIQAGDGVILNEDNTVSSVAGTSSLFAVGPQQLIDTPANAGSFPYSSLVKLDETRVALLYTAGNGANYLPTDLFVTVGQINYDTREINWGNKILVTNNTPDGWNNIHFIEDTIVCVYELGFTPANNKIGFQAFKANGTTITRTQAELSVASQQNQGFTYVTSSASTSDGGINIFFCDGYYLTAQGSFGKGYNIFVSPEADGSLTYITKLYQSTERQHVAGICGYHEKSGYTVLYHTFLGGFFEIFRGGNLIKQGNNDARPNQQTYRPAATYEPVIERVIMLGSPLSNNGDSLTVYLVDVDNSGTPTAEPQALNIPTDSISPIYPSVQYDALSDKTYILWTDTETSTMKIATLTFDSDIVQGIKVTEGEIYEIPDILNVAGCGFVSMNNGDAVIAYGTKTVTTLIAERDELVAQQARIQLLDSSDPDYIPLDSINRRINALNDSIEQMQNDPAQVDASSPQVKTFLFSLAYADSNLTSDNFVGFAYDNYADGEKARIDTHGAINTKQEGLVADQQYYMLGNGDLFERPNTLNVPAGIGQTETSILVKLN